MISIDDYGEGVMLIVGVSLANANSYKIEKMMNVEGTNLKLNVNFFFEMCLIV